MESKGYIDLTLDMMKKFGVEVINNNYKEFLIKGNQKYKSVDYYVEGDFSQAAFYLCADALGNDIWCKDLDENSLQGDKEIIDILKRMNNKFISKDKKIKCETDKLNTTIIDGSQCPDIIPVLALVGTLTEGTTIITNASRLRIKECDRLSAVREELSKLGANITEKEDGLIITGVKKLRGNTKVWSHKDHRIAMTLAIASTLCDKPIIIKDHECISKSYPKFFEDFEKLGGKIYEMGEYDGYLKI